MLQEPNNEQKLTYIYQSLKDQDSRRIRAIWYKALKWVIILGLAYLALTNPGFIIGKMTEIIQPIVMDQMKTMMEKNKESLMESVQDFIKTSPQVPPDSTRKPSIK